MFKNKAQEEKEGLQMEIAELNKEKNKLVDERYDFEAKIDKK